LSAGAITVSGTDNTKIGDVSGGKYVEIVYSTGMLESGGPGGINWSNINPIRPKSSSSIIS
jgi:hypothetical protein